MKIIVFFSTLSIVFVACNNVKQNPSTIVIGETKDMVVIEYNKTFNGVFSWINSVNTGTAEFDMIGDEDIFFCYK